MDHLDTVLVLQPTVGCGDEVHVQTAGICGAGVLVPCEAMQLTVLYFQYFSMFQHSVLFQCKCSVN